MPSIIMKNMNVGSLGEKKAPGICQKSKLICKRSPSHDNIFQLAEDMGSCTQSCRFVSSSSKETSISNGPAECVLNHELGSGKYVHYEEQSTSLAVAQSADGRDDTTTSSSTNMDPFFSSLVNEFKDGDRCRINDDEGSNVDSEHAGNNTADESDGNSAGSADYNTCTVSDFFISDMVLAGFQFDGNIIREDNVEISSLQHYNAADSSFLFDASEQYCPLPFFDDSLNFNVMHKNPPYEEAKWDSFGSSLFSVVHQMSPGIQGSDLDPYPDSEQTEYLDPLAFIRNLPDLSDVAPAVNPTIFSKEGQKNKPVTLVLDLDETLVHSSVEYCEDADFTFTIFFNMKEHTIYVKQRPHLHTFLNRVAEMFDIVVFTASQKVYAEQLLNILDPDGKLISGRAYRESCIFSNDTHTKDLTVLGLDLAKVVIIDNSPQVFRLQVNNGIPIKSWFDDPSDDELISLIPFLETLADVDDVRPIIAQRFGNKE